MAFPIFLYRYSLLSSVTVYKWFEPEPGPKKCQTRSESILFIAKCDVYLKIVIYFRPYLGVVRLFRAHLCSTAHENYNA